MNPETERKLTAWVPAVVYTGFVFAVSSIPGGLSVDITFRFVDKLAHMVEYAGLGLFLAIGYAGSMPAARRQHVMLFAVLTGFAIGALDETYQRLVPGRAVELLDWGADVVGVMIGNAVARLHLGARGRGWAAARRNG